MGHKRILGRTKDFITGREITDTDDERYRQKIARFLVEKKGYAKDDIEVRRRFEFEVDGAKVLSMVDFVVKVKGIYFMAIRYGPGSLVTRERPALASARILESDPLPLTVVTNGEDAELLDTATGKVIAHGLESIPGKDEVLKRPEGISSARLTGEKREIEKRILAAYDWFEHSLECDADWCETE